MPNYADTRYIHIPLDHPSNRPTALPPYFTRLSVAPDHFNLVSSNSGRGAVSSKHVRKNGSDQSPLRMEERPHEKGASDKRMPVYVFHILYILGTPPLLRGAARRRYRTPGRAALGRILPATAAARRREGRRSRRARRADRRRAWVEVEVYSRYLLYLRYPDAMLCYSADTCAHPMLC